MSSVPEITPESYTAALLRELASRDEPHTLQSVVDLAVETVPACDWAGVTVRHKKKLTTPASTNVLVEKADQAQYDLGEGPCIDAIYQDDTYIIEDVRTEVRWPRWAPAAHQLGIGSVLSVRLSTREERVGGLNLYAGVARAFDDDDVQIAHAYADHAAAALAVVHEVAGLRSALQTRNRIGIAQGILRARHELDVDQAFSVLVRLSRDNNVLLREVADLVIESNGLPRRFTGE